ncbi:phospholipase/carboxylesterase [Chitinophaga costaii]|uniref:Phospholipase/carboxylesterase n=1 Tax=Chitinophaga costaii TaxID=1335309 RepID=A0A1C4ENG8_9BACT|nr:dienelactone hydrolase family protein [Chitinophaga costaii]PUZ22462.1 phospholipase [Chitinophaga costaii]SCC45077.1 phospholipase/carboxylesterase [Chitinophaga costaii]
MHKKQYLTGGAPVSATGKVLILLHGRGGSAEDILTLAPHLHVRDYALLAPQATGGSWYPYSFLAPTDQNEPYLSAALHLIDEIVHDLNAQGVSNGNIYFLGFSQGACLMLEYITRHATRYGGAAAFTGGLIGDQVKPATYANGDFKGTPIFIGTSDPDMHVPVARVEATTKILQEKHANVYTKIYPNMGHTISQDEITQANAQVFKLV